MRVFGIDCGTEFTGYGVVEVDCDARMPKADTLLSRKALAFPCGVKADGSP